MQNYEEISTTTSLSDSLSKILNNDKTALSNSSGTSFPTTNLQVGMSCFRIDLDTTYKLKSDGPAVWEISDSFDTLSDVTITAKIDDHIIKWDQTSGKWINVTLAGAGISDTSHNHSLDSLNNVTVTSNSTGEILKWSGSAWVNNTLAEAGISGTGHNHALDALSNVTITSNSTGEILKWSGSAWINNTLAQAGISATSHTHAGVYANESHTHAEGDLPNASTSAQGVVQLSSSLVGTSETKAATEKAAKDLKDLIDIAAAASIIQSDLLLTPTQGTTHTFISDNRSYTTSSENPIVLVSLRFLSVMSGASINLTFTATVGTGTGTYLKVYRMNADGSNTEVYNRSAAAGATSPSINIGGLDSGDIIAFVGHTRSDSSDTVVVSNIKFRTANGAFPLINYWTQFVSGGTFSADS